jgi:hypothetical protein
MKLQGKTRSNRGKTCLSVTLSTTNRTWTDLGSNLGLRGGRLATNRLSHSTVEFVLLVEAPSSEKINCSEIQIRLARPAALNPTFFCCNVMTIHKFHIQTI